MEGYDTLHDLLVKLFNEIMNIEEQISFLTRGCVDVVNK